MEAPISTRMRARKLRNALSLPEALLWRALKGGRQDGLHFRKQHPLGPYVLDFYCHAGRLAIEVDGASHSLGGQPGRDARRDTWLRAQGVRTLRISAEFVLRDIDGAVRMIVATIRGP